MQQKQKQQSQFSNMTNDTEHITDSIQANHSYKQFKTEIKSYISASHIFGF